ncbi:MAG: response regulator [Nitrospinaceae bacterium]|nr:response regulator [Nitrospinaceae bacterium]NIU97906.1 response regulator [Nitrospinaceae bacterium]NIW60480.1 response regulator [Nitrospinaceae bacterium]
MVVDDEVKMCVTLTKLFELSRYQVEVAHNGLEALEKVESFQPHCILLDIRMPQMNGLEVLEKVKENHADIPVIMTTAVAMDETREECLEKGAAEYLIKPIDFKTLLAKVNDLVKSVHNT